MKLSEVQEVLAGRIKADPYFADIDVLTEKTGDVVNKVDQLIAKLKIAVIVHPAKGSLIGNKGLKVCDVRVFCSVSVTEKLVANTTSQHALDVLQEVIRVVHGSTAENSRGDAFYLDENVFYALPAEGSLVSYVVNFYTQVSIK